MPEEWINAIHQNGLEYVKLPSINSPDGRG